MEKKAPWKAIKEDDSQESNAATTLALSADILRISTELLFPIMPNKTTEILNILGCKPIISLDLNIGGLKAGTKLNPGKTPFPRIIQ